MLLLYTDLKGHLLRRQCAAGEVAALISGSVPEGWQSPSESDLRLIQGGTWHNGGGAACEQFAFGNVRTTKGERYPLCPRTTTESVQDACRAKNLEIRVGVELEFHLFDTVRAATSAFENSVCFAGVDGHFHSDEAGLLRQVASTTRDSLFGTDAYLRVRSDIAARLAAQGVDVEGEGHETGTCQNEISLAPLPIVDAADAVQLAKWAIKDVAAKHGLQASFIPRPLAYEQGSGLHLNISAWHDGTNLFYEPAQRVSAQGRAFASGLLKHVRALCAVCNPMVNSYSRLLNCFDAEKGVALAVGNREVILRVPPEGGAARTRLELRLPDSAANPYLAIAAAVQAGLDGWSSSPGGRAVQAATASKLPASLIEAALSLDEDHAFLMVDGAFDGRLVQAVAAVAKSTYFRTLKHLNPVELALGYPV